MIKLFVILPILYFSFPINSPAQMTRKEKLIEYKKLSKEDLTRLAVEDMLKLEDENLECWDLTAYSVKVLYNETDMKVEFTLSPIVFLGINTCYYANLYGDLITHRFAMEVIANPSDYKATPHFYKQYLEYEESEQVDFVLDAINSKDGSSYTRKNYTGKMIIRENKIYYKVSIHYASQITYFKIEKETGRKYDEKMRNIKVVSLEDYTEIKE